MFQHHLSNANNLVAVQYVLDNFSQGNRAHVPDDVIIISEAHALNYFNHHQEDVAINQLHQMSHNVIAVGLGSVNQNEMNWVATDRNHFFLIENIFHFNFHSFVSTVTNLIRCN
jgi:hypothetical protein